MPERASTCAARSRRSRETRGGWMRTSRSCPRARSHRTSQRAVSFADTAEFEAGPPQARPAAGVAWRELGEHASVVVGVLISAAPRQVARQREVREAPPASSALRSASSTAAKSRTADSSSARASATTSGVDRPASTLARAVRSPRPRPNAGRAWEREIAVRSIGSAVPPSTPQRSVTVGRRRRAGARGATDEHHRQNQHTRAGRRAELPSDSCARGAAPCQTHVSTND